MKLKKKTSSFENVKTDYSCAVFDAYALALCLTLKTCYCVWSL